MILNVLLTKLKICTELSLVNNVQRVYLGHGYRIQKIEAYLVEFG